MGLMMALNAAVSGLRTTQDSMNITAQNVANANSVGYTRRTMSPIQQTGGRPDRRRARGRDPARPRRRSPSSSFGSNWPAPPTPPPWRPTHGSSTGFSARRARRARSTRWSTTSPQSLQALLNDPGSVRRAPRRARQGRHPCEPARAGVRQRSGAADRGRRPDRARRRAGERAPDRHRRGERSASCRTSPSTIPASSTNATG